MDKACSMKLKRTGHLGDLKEVGCKDVEWIHIAHNRAQ
jgi:hypothetical protein